jgi:hypothetical protein
MVEKNGVRFPRIGTPEQHYVRLFNFTVRACAASCSKDCRQTGDAWRVSSPVAAIDVVAAYDGPHKFLRNIVQFIGSLRATEHPKSARPVVQDFVTNTRGGKLQRFFPTCGSMLAVLANQGSGQPSDCAVFHIPPLNTRTRTKRVIITPNFFSLRRILAEPESESYALAQFGGGLSRYVSRATNGA